MSANVPALEAAIIGLVDTVPTSSETQAPRVQLVSVNREWHKSDELLSLMTVRMGSAEQKLQILMNDLAERKAKEDSQFSKLVLGEVAFVFEK